MQKFAGSIWHTVGAVRVKGYLCPGFMFIAFTEMAYKCIIKFNLQEGNVNVSWFSFSLGFFYTYFVLVLNSFHHKSVGRLQDYLEINKYQVIVFLSLESIWWQ